jgi:hypothetical protein
MDDINVHVDGKITHESGNPAKIEVTRGQRGGYGWTISLAGSDPGAIVDQLKEIDTNLQASFQGPGGE